MAKPGVSARVSEFFRFTTTRPVAILMVVLGVCVFGAISYQQLPVNLMPDISYPSLTVRTEFPGTAPEEIETSISRPIEQSLGVVANVVNISSISKAGQSDVKLEFTWDADMAEVTADVREKLDQVFMPDDAERPLILRYDPTLDPIMRLGLYGDKSLTRMRYRAEEEIKRILETLEGVAAVKVKGGLEEEIRVELDENQLTLIGVDIQQVRNRLQQENVNLAGGNLKEGQTEYLVRTLNEFKTVSEVADVVIGNWNNREIKVRDIAKVTRTNKEREIMTRIDGKESVEIEIYKEADANIVSVAERVRRRIFGTPEQQAFVKRMEERESKKDEKKDEDEDKEAEPTNGAAESTNGRNGADNVIVKKRMTNFIAYNLPDQTEIGILSDQSVFIENSVDEVKKTAFYGGLLAIVVLFIFLRNFTATLIIGIAIPISIIATFAPMKIFDVTLNIMSLGGLALGIGMLVDNSIVVLESIARCRDEGDDLVQATLRGVSEVGSAVFASTLTTVAVFFPIVFVEGIAGQIFGDMALTVVFSLLASLAVALFLIPMLSSRETSRFAMQDMLSSQDASGLLSYRATEFLDSHYAEDRKRGNISTGASNFVSWLKTFAMTPVEMLMKAGGVLLAAVLSLGKGLFQPVAALISPLLALISRFLKRETPLNTSLTEMLQRKSLFGNTLIEKYWAGALSFEAFQGLIAGARDRVEKRRQSGWLKWSLTLPFFLLSIVAIAFRFFVHNILELFQRFAVGIVYIVAVLLKGFFLMVKLLVTGRARDVVAGFDWIYQRIADRYPGLLNSALENRMMVLGGTALLFVLTVWGVGSRLGSELIPEVHQGEFNVEVTLPVGTPVENTDRRMLDVQAMIQQTPGVASIATVSGTDRTSNNNSEEGEHTASLTVSVKRDRNIIEQEESVISALRREMAEYSGLTWKIARPVLFSFKTPIEVEIQGYNLNTLQEISSELEETLKSIPGLYDIKSNIQRGNPEVQIIYNRALLAQYGLNIRDVASIVRNKIRGDVATEFKERDRKIDIRVQLEENDRQSIDDLRRLVVNPGSMRPITLAAVANIRINEGPSEIRRVDQQRTALITANISGRDLQSVSNDIVGVLQQTDMPDDFSYSLAGQNEEMQTSLNSLMLALGLAVFLVYIVMASQFESLIHPFVIIFTIPLALIGVILGLFVLGTPLSIVVFLGMIMLAGIVVNNAIVLVDYINQLRERGFNKLEAIVEAGKARLRPILMTTLTTVLGLLPMAIGFGDGAEIRTPMAVTVILGLIASTLLTLVVIPTVYSVVDRRP